MSRYEADATVTEGKFAVASFSFTSTRWIRNISLELWPEFKNVGTIDSLIASTICAATAKMKQSDVEFNQGGWYFGSRCTDYSNKLLLELQGLQSSGGKNGR
jgi:hypothetical protein